MASILPQEKGVINATSSNRAISKSEKNFWIFFCISGIYIKFEILWKKDEPQRWFVAEIMDCKKRGSLNA